MASIVRAEVASDLAAGKYANGANGKEQHLFPKSKQAEAAATMIQNWALRKKYDKYLVKENLADRLELEDDVRDRNHQFIATMLAGLLLCLNMSALLNPSPHMSRLPEASYGS